MRSNGKTAVVAYVPALTANYLKFFHKYEGLACFVLGKEFLTEHQSVLRHLSGNAPEDIRTMLQPFGYFHEIRVLNPPDLTEVQKFEKIVIPDEGVSCNFATKYLTTQQIIPDGSWRMRWDWKATQQNRRPAHEGTISHRRFDQELMHKAVKVARRSPDWWRQVGALLVKEGAVLMAGFNDHLPSEHSAYLEGDPRSNFEPGQCIDLSLALHAEQAIVGEAARRGFSMEGCDLYVTTFPCPGCARLCATTGIRRLYYAGGYSLVDGAEALQSRGVETIRVQM